MQSAEAFVDSVRAALSRIDEERYQEQLDVVLLGGTVSCPVPQPDPDCTNCWGYGKVCPCHGVVAAHGASNDWRVALRQCMRSWNTEACDCIKRQRRG